MATGKADVIARLLLHTEGFDRNLDSSKKKISAFSNGISATGNIIGKFAGIIGITATGIETFNKVINSSQTISDAFKVKIATIKTTVDEFFYSISNGDWTNFFSGFDGIISRAKDAAEALDQLGNTKISYNYFNVKNMAGVQDQIAILKDKTSSETVKQTARVKLNEILKDQKEIVDVFSSTAEDAMKKLVSSWTGVNGADISQFDIDKIARIDVSKTREETKERLSKQYKEYQKLYSEVIGKHSVTTIQNSSAGAITATATNWGKVREEINGVISKYKEAIIFNGILNKKTDEQLQEMLSIGQAADEAKRNYAAMIKSANRASQNEGSTNSTNQKEFIPEASLSDLQNQLTKAKKTLCNAVGIEAQTAAQETINEIERRIQAMNFKIETQLFQKSHPLSSSAQASMSNISSRKDLSSLANKNIPKTLDVSDKIKTIGEISKETFGRGLDELKAYGNGLGYITNMASSLGSAFSSMGQDGIAAMFNLVGSVASGIQQYAELTAAAQASAIASGTASAAKMPFPYNIAAIATIVATIMSVFASIQQFAEGGIVGGTSFTGDKVLARVNSGEMILNKNQQRNLFNILESGGGIVNRVSVDGEARVSGKDLYIAIRNYMKSTNKAW